MKYVLDVNVALKWALNEVDSTKARRLRDDWRAQIHDLLHCPCGAARSARHPVKVEAAGSNPVGGIEEGRRKKGKGTCHKEFVNPQTRRLGTGEPRWP